MTEEQKIEIATFRFGVIADFVNGARLYRKEKRRLIKEKCDRKWEIPYSEKTRISNSTLFRWIRLYEASGGRLESLYPRDRSDQGKSRSLNEEISQTLIRMRTEMVDATVPQLLVEMKKRRLLPPGKDLPIATVYRFLHRQGCMDKKASPPEDRRKFEAELPNDIWQSDVMHGPQVIVDGKRRKSYLIAFMDDHSRLVPYGSFYLSETIGSFLKALEKALLKRGLPRKLYVDNGPAFRSKKLEYATAALGIALIHSRPYKPEGRGKIERFFREVRKAILAGLTIQSLEDLNRLFEKWLNEVYHQRKHGGTGMSPFKRFTTKMECIRTPPTNLTDYFRKRVQRTVAKDRTVVLEGKLYEAPVPLIKKRVMLIYHENTPEQVEVVWEQKSYGFLVPVDLNVNCRVRRNKNSGTELQTTSASLYEGGCLWTGEGENE